MENIFSPDVQRGNYLRVLAAIGQPMGLTAEQVQQNYKVTPFILKMAAYLDPNTSSYSFNPRKGVNAPNPAAILLEQTDMFAVTAMGLRFGRAAFASGTYSNHGNYPVFTYPDPAYFSGTGTTAGSEAAGLQNIVHSRVSVTVSGDVVIEDLLAQDLCYNPDGTFTSSPAAHPSFGGLTRGLFDLTPTLILDGGQDNTFKVELPSSGTKGNIDGAISTGTTDSGTRNILYFVCQGYKIKNKGAYGKPVCNTTV